MRTATLLSLGLLFLTSAAPPVRSPIPPLRLTAPLTIHPQAGTRPTAPTSVTDLAWLEGIWRGEVGGRQFEARYTSPEGGQILSASKYTENGKPAGFEFERFEQRGDTVMLTPFPQGKSSVSFPLTDYNAKGHRAVFENLAHDFPTRISYQLLGTDRLTILVSGPGEDGNEQVLTYALKRR